MNLNDLKPPKGAKSRSGFKHKRGFEGGQMPLHRRLPKRGFTSLSRDLYAEVRLGDLEKLAAGEIDLALLKSEGLVPRQVLTAKVILAGKLTRKLTLNGVGVTKGARAAIEGAGGQVLAAAEAKPKAQRKAKPE